MADKDGLNVGFKISTQENERLELLMKEYGFNTKAKLIRFLINKNYDIHKIEQENKKLKVHLANLKALLKDGF